LPTCNTPSHSPALPISSSTVLSQVVPGSLVLITSGSVLDNTGQPVHRPHCHCSNWSTLKLLTLNTLPGPFLPQKSQQRLAPSPLSPEDAGASQCGPAWVTMHHVSRKLCANSSFMTIISVPASYHVCLTQTNLRSILKYLPVLAWWQVPATVCSSTPSFSPFMSGLSGQSVATHLKAASLSLSSEIQVILEI
jgi:hypothetical protein